MPSRWSGSNRTRQGKAKTKLARTGTGAVKQLHVLAAASLAGFEVITDGGFAVITEAPFPRELRGAGARRARHGSFLLDFVGQTMPPGAHAP